ncbi:flagellar basal body rod protein FlgF, partial [Alcanivorax sp. 521-1]
MDRILYTAMSGAKQTMDRQAVVSNNLANVSTAGFRGQLHALRAVPVQGDAALPTRASVVAATPGSDFSAGPMNATGRDLDVALQGNAWLAVQSEDGGEAYTRRGDLQVDGDGVLNSAGRPVIGEGGPIVVPLGPVSDHGDGARLLPSLPDAALWHRLGARP